MRANELRIGNLIKDEHGTLSNIVEITDYDRIAVGNNRVVKDLSNCEPIPLTEEWLIKFGFQNYETERYTPNQEDSELFEYRLASGISYRDYICKPYHGWIIKLGDYDDSLEIKFVHQFQNIYFALNGEELTIK